MKILHTSDLHLTDKKNYRWEALTQLLKIADEQQVELMVISGDLFDSKKAGEHLRTEIRHLFSQNSYTIVLIPGNHDSEVFNRGFYLGDNVITISDYRKPLHLKQVDIWGFPYRKMEKQEVQRQIIEIEDIINRQKRNILLFHGELLDTMFCSEDYGDEVSYRYMPVKLDYFQKSSFNYILAGHYHTKFDVRTFNENGYFVYPGSPVSVTRKEIGRRKVNLFSLGNPPEEFDLQTFHYIQVEVSLNPLSDINPYSIIADQLNKIQGEQNIILNIKGYYRSSEFKLTEQQLIEKIKTEFSKKLDSINSYFKDVKFILDDDLYIKFQTELEKQDISPENKQKLTDIFIETMCRVDI
ncbi:MAG: hypothetical protein APR63_11530 [Desulfuromonas sp. SDB]|nr:MAG: hypothetical protein APR63_11530 [Desulfuromonas sp. SDB]